MPVFPSDIPMHRPGRLRLSNVIALVILCAMLLFVLGVYAVVLSRRHPQSQTTLATLAAAERKWRQHGPASYDLELEKIGARNDQIELKVRDGQAVHFVVNGIVPQQRRLWDTWTVPSQFEYIRADLQRVVPPESSPPLIRAEFDPDTGVPRSYTYVGQQGFSTGWKIRTFRAIPP